MSCCRCNELFFVHTHCNCNRCKGKAVSRSTRRNHEDRARATTGELFSSSFQTSQNNGENIINENNENNSANDYESSSEDNENHDKNHDGNFSGKSSKSTQTNCIEEEIEQKVLAAILNALPMKEAQGDSVESFENWLKWARDFVITDPLLKDRFPSNWQEVLGILSAVGYSKPREYFICLNESHKGLWDIMESSSDKCKHCNQPGGIKYYYLGLKDKLKRWCKDLKQCRKMLGHWTEREHWFRRHDQENVDTTGWPIKNEIWDGYQFSTYSWFFDPEAEWMLPTYCRCGAVISTQMLEKGEHLPDGKVSVVCTKCRVKLCHTPEYTTGDPRNVMYIGHWDGFQPFGTSVGHSCGCIEVSIATMKKCNRLHTDQVFVVGFVPTYLLPDTCPEFLDPFLKPLVDEIGEGFIYGVDVDYSVALPELDLEEGPAKIRHLIFLWSGDHPAQCEVSKCKRQGKRGCRRDSMVGQLPHQGATMYYYGNNRFRARSPWPLRNLLEEVELIQVIENEEGNNYDRLSKMYGYTGESTLMDLFYLYGFDILHDTVIDLQHNLPLNPVKKFLLRGKNNGTINIGKLEERLEAVPWTAEYKASRYPATITERLGFWKAEEHQKFAFPISEVILNEEVLNDEDFGVWQPLARMCELVYNKCRSYGWKAEDVNLFHSLALRHCILVEEHYGLEQCVITLHNLIHVSQDIDRFGPPDNYWVYQFERAVKRYIEKSSNHKNIEKTFADNEVRREILQFSKYVQTKDEESFPCESEIACAVERCQATSLAKATQLLKTCKQRNFTETENGIFLCGSKTERKYALTLAEKQNILLCLQTQEADTRIEDVPNVSLLMRSLLKDRPVDQYGKDDTAGLLFRPGEDVIVELNNTEICCKIIHFHSLLVKCKYRSLVETELYKYAVTESGEQLKHRRSSYSLAAPLGESVFLQHCSLKRKVMMYPEPIDSRTMFVVIDFDRPSLPMESQTVLVPFYPVGDEMVIVCGENDAEWLAHITSVNQDDQTVEAFFFTVHPRWPGSRRYIRENRGKCVIHWNSIIGAAKGVWTRHSREWLMDT